MQTGFESRYLNKVLFTCLSITLNLVAELQKITNRLNNFLYTA